MDAQIEIARAGLYVCGAALALVGLTLAAVGILGKRSATTRTMIQPATTDQAQDVYYSTSSMDPASEAEEAHYISRGELHRQLDTIGARSRAEQWVEGLGR